MVRYKKLMAGHEEYSPNDRVSSFFPLARTYQHLPISSRNCIPRCFSVMCAPRQCPAFVVRVSEHRNQGCLDKLREDVCNSFTCSLNAPRREKTEGFDLSMITDIVSCIVIISSPDGKYAAGMDSDNEEGEH